MGVGCGRLPGEALNSLRSQCSGLWAGKVAMLNWWVGGEEPLGGKGLFLPWAEPLAPPPQTITSTTSPSLSLAWMALPVSLLIRSMTTTVTARMAQMNQVSSFFIRSFIMHLLSSW